MDRKFIWIVGGGLALILILIVVLVIINLSGERQKTINPTTTLTIWDYNNEKNAYDSIINSFQGQQKNVKVQYVNKNANGYIEDTMSAIAAGKGPDIWIVPAEFLPQYKDALIAMPDNKLAKPKEKKNDLEVYRGTFPSVVAQDNIPQDKIYGAPIAIDTLKLYINTSTMETVRHDYQVAHPTEDNTAINRLLGNGPKNWDELVTIVRVITKKSGTKIERSAIALGTADNITNAADILTLLMLQNGAKMVSEDLALSQFHTQQNLFSGLKYPGAKALEFYASFANPKNENYTWNGSMSDSLRSFAEGKTAMMLDYNTAQNEIKNINDKLMFNVANVPQVRETQNPVNLAHYDTLTVTKSSSNTDLAWDFILAATTSNLNSSYREITKKTLAQTSNLYNDQALTAQSWYNPDVVKVREIFKNMIQQVNEGKDAQTAVEGAASQVTTLLQKLKAGEQ